VKSAALLIQGLFLGSILALPTPCPGALSPEGFHRDDRLGVCTHFGQKWPIEPIMPLVAQSGAGWIRDELGWAAMETKPGLYHLPAKTIAWIHAAKAAGLKIDLILSYGNPIYPDHYDTVAYAHAAAWLAREVASDVQAIEILNEPNNFGFQSTYGGAWNGNERGGSVSPYVKKYVEILNAAAKEVKLANPQMTVIGLGAPAPANFRMIALGLAPEVEGLTDHPYSTGVPELIPYPANPAMLVRDGIATADGIGTFVSQVAMYREQAKKFGATDHLWHTEWGYSTVQARPEKNQRALSPEVQAVYTVRRILQSEGTNVEHSFIYDFKDDGTDPFSDYDNFGLVKNDLSPKTVFGAVQRLSALLGGLAPVPAGEEASIKTDPSPDQGLGHQVYTFASADKKKKLVAFWEAKPWEPNPVTASAVIEWPLAHPPAHLFLCDLLTGQETAIPYGKAGQEGQISITVPISATPKVLISR
jgi:hypothetical protein